MGVNVLFLQHANSMYASVGVELGDLGLDAGSKLNSGAHFVYVKCP